jgi:hypothetical protein
MKRLHYQRNYLDEIGALEQWRRWFAWHPVKIDGKRYWLKTIERKGTYWVSEDMLDVSIIWEYRPL